MHIHEGIIPPWDFGTKLTVLDAQTDPPFMRLKGRWIGGHTGNALSPQFGEAERGKA